MCGIIGYVGNKNASEVILDGLKRLEYRGYDSAGIAVFNNSEIVIQRTEGKLDRLVKVVSEHPMKGTVGIGHTRWATHGRPSDTNAHPHRSGGTVIVHNGIIENFAELKKMLVSEGYRFSSETDTEAICHLIEYFLKKNSGSTFSAIKDAIGSLRGSYALVIMNEKEPDKIYVVRRGGSPLVVGEGSNERLVASDVPALLPYTKDMIFLEDGDFAVLDSKEIDIRDERGEKVLRKVQHIPWTPLMAERGGYKHFMLKEIFEQSEVVEDAVTGRIDYVNNTVTLDEVNSLFDGPSPLFNKITIVACGTSWHAALVGRYFIESFAKIPVSVELASEFRYRTPLIDDRTLIIPISQSGETADTLAALRLAKEMGAKVLAICNVVGSSITRSADATLYTHAGPEIGVASTKAFTAQLVVLYLLALNLASRVKKISLETMTAEIVELVKLPRYVKNVLAQAPKIKSIAEKMAESTHFLFIGRNVNYPVALEGALKLKEISYVHAEGFAAGELKHGPIALVDHGVPVVAIVPQDDTYEKLLSNIEEVKARGAHVVALATKGDKTIEERAGDIISLPKTSWALTPILACLPLQLLAYYIADRKGTDVDQPRNLAKSVTVE